MTKSINKQELEILLLLSAIKKFYAIDFSHYKTASLKRRLQYNLEKHNLVHISELIPHILWNHKNFEDLLFDISIPVTEMYRDPEVYAQITKKVIPFLKTFPKSRIWIAGCATGEEAYSLAILLLEANYLEHCQIIATDFNQNALTKAELGIYSQESINSYALAYLKAGGKYKLTNYFMKKENMMQIDPELRTHVSFMQHNLMDGPPVLNTNLILCRNVFIYFDRELQQKVTDTFYQSLTRGGFLCLGLKESLDFLKQKRFSNYDEKYRIYRKSFDSN